MVLLGDLNFREKVAVELQCRRQVVKGLLKVAVFQVGFAQFCVGRHQNEQVLLVDVYEQLAQSELLDADLDHTVNVLGQGEFIQSFIALD